MSLKVFEDVLARRLPDTAGPGVQVVVVSSRGIVYQGARGLADPLGNVDKRKPTTPSHQANLYSVTKFFTACCVLKLIEEGKLAPSTKARDVLPETMKDLVNDCTIEQLVLHTASAPNPLPLSWVHGVSEQVEEESLLRGVLQKNRFPRTSGPGKGKSYRYSNVGYWILGSIIAQVCNKPMSSFSEICHDLLFRGNLADGTGKTIGTTFFKDRPTAVGYVSRWSILALAVRFLCPSWLIGSSNSSWIRMKPHYLDGASFGGIISSSLSVSSFLQLLLKEQVLGPESLRRLFTPQTREMTFGLHVRSHGGMPVYHKEGGGAGTHSSIHFRPYQDLAACVIAGDAEFDVNSLIDELLDCAATTNLAMLKSRGKYVTAEDKCMLHTRCFSTAREASPQLSEPILLIHGGPGVPDYLEPLARLLLEENLAPSVITFDQRGVGKSRQGCNRISMDLMVGDIECIRKAYGATRLHIMGHSWGGILAQLYAIQHVHCVCSVVLLSSNTATQSSEWSHVELQVLKYNLRKAGWVNFTKMGIFSMLMALPGISDFGARRLLPFVMKNYYYDPSTAPNPPASFLEGISAKACIATKNAFLRDVTSTMKVPSGIKSLAIFGESDIYGAEQVKKFCDQFPGKVEIVQHSSHLTWFDQPKVLVRTLQSFLVGE